MTYHLPVLWLELERRTVGSCGLAVREEVEEEVPGN